MSDMFGILFNLGTRVQLQNYKLPVLNLQGGNKYVWISGF